MTTAQHMIIILLCALGTMLTRFLPFVFFPAGKPTPRFIRYLSNALPPAVFSMLVVYCLKGVSWTAAPHGLPELLSIAAVAAVHRWKGNVLLSIAGGTVLYMLLVQTVFA